MYSQQRSVETEDNTAEIITQGRAQFLILENEESRWGLLNVYAPNHASARARLWEEIYMAVPGDVGNWIVGGDFNMLEDPHDRRGGSIVTIEGLALANWERLVLKLRIFDVWHLKLSQRSRISQILKIG